MLEVLNKLLHVVKWNDLDLVCCFWNHVLIILKLILNCCRCCLVIQSCWFFVTPWTVAHQAPLSMGFSRQEYWSGVTFPSPEDLSDPGTEMSLALPVDSSPLSHLRSPKLLISKCWILGKHSTGSALYRLLFSYLEEFTMPWLSVLSKVPETETQIISQQYLCFSLEVEEQMPGESWPKVLLQGCGLWPWTLCFNWPRLFPSCS